MKFADVKTRHDWERMYAERGKSMSAGMAAARSEGRHVGRVPAGYRISFDQTRGKFVENDPRLAPLVREAFAMAASGKFSISQIAAVLAERGWTAANGKSLSPATLHGMLHNRTYLAGFAEAKPLVDSGTFFIAQGAMKARVKGMAPCNTR